MDLELTESEPDDLCVQVNKFALQNGKPASEVPLLTNKTIAVLHNLKAACS